jgi:hypothetical protein
MRAIWLMTGVVVLLGSSVYGQWVPIKGTRTTTIQIIGTDGRVTSHQETHERYFRSSSGSILIQHVADDGSNRATTGLLLDSGRSGKSYQVDYAGGAVNDLHRPAKRVPARTRADLATAKQQKELEDCTISGVQCVIASIKIVGSDGKKTTIGKGWSLPDYNFLMVKEDTIRSLPDGRYVHTVREMQDLEAGVEPDSALFGTDANSIKGAATVTAVATRVPGDGLGSGGLGHDVEWAPYRFTGTRADMVAGDFCFSAGEGRSTKGIAGR